jgi:hypothetical protein
VRRWIALAARLYPRSWRERYGHEFDALLEDASADWRQLRNVLSGALSMQLANYLSYLKAGGATAVAGAILAIALSYRVPPRYVSSATLVVTPVVDEARSAQPDVLRMETDDRVMLLKRELTSRDNILRIARDPGLGLYDAEHQQSPWEDVAEQVHNDNDIQILPVALPGRKGTAFRISFAYRDKQKAQAVVNRMIGELLQMNEQDNGTSATQWETRWSDPIPFRYRLDLVEPASVPPGLARPRRAIFLAFGAGVGLLVGLLALSFRRHPKAGSKIAACGLAGGAIAGGLSFLIAEQYTVSARLRFAAPLDPKHFSGSEAAIPASEWVQRFRKEILDDNGYSILRNPKLGLDEATAAALYKDPGRVIGLRMADPWSDVAASSSFEITFSHPDPLIARAVVQELVSQIFSRYIADLGGQSIVIDEQPVTPDKATTHYRLQLTVAGAAMGILLAVARWSGGSVQPATAHP